jgi:hypothetical protein
MRVYAPVDLNVLRAWAAGTAVDIRFGWAVTPSLQDGYGFDASEQEFGEYIAMALAAAASRSASGGQARRVVAAVEVVAEPDDTAAEPGKVRIAAPVLRSDVASIHIDDGVYAAPADDELDDVTDLHWYDGSELEQVLANLTAADNQHTR